MQLNDGLVWRTRSCCCHRRMPLTRGISAPSCLQDQAQERRDATYEDLCKLKKYPRFTGYMLHMYVDGSTIVRWFYHLLLALPSSAGSTIYCWLYHRPLVLPSTVGSTIVRWFYHLLLALPSSAGSTIYCWLCHRPLVLPSTVGSTIVRWFTIYCWLYHRPLVLPSTVGSTIVRWFYHLLLALPSSAGSTIYCRLYRVQISILWAHMSLTVALPPAATNSTHVQLPLSLTVAPHIIINNTLSYSSYHKKKLWVTTDGRIFYWSLFWDMYVHRI